MENFETYKAVTLDILGEESGKRYRDSTLRIGMRLALEAYTRHFPRLTSETVPIHAIENMQVILRWQLPENAELTAVQLPGRSAPIRFPGFYARPLAEGLAFTFKAELLRRLSVGDSLTLHLRENHVIQGVYSDALTTLPAQHMTLVCQGAAGYAMQSRAAAIAELFSKRPEDFSHLMHQSNAMIAVYLETLQRRALTENQADDPPLPRKGFEI